MGLLALLMVACIPPGPAVPRDSPDPFIFRYGATWYMFSTAIDVGGVHYDIPVWASGNLHSWRLVRDALPPASIPLWGSRYDTWAPSVYRRADGIWVLYLSTAEPRRRRHVVAVATARTPAGPYNGRPYLPLEESGSAREPTWGAIDPSPVMYRGRLYLLWKSDAFPATAAAPARVWARQLRLDGLGWVPGSPLVLLMSGRPGWQRFMVEGPAMLPLPSGGGILFYSGGWYASTGYATGWASCPAGPTAGCTDRSALHPWLSSRGGGYGPGGAEIVRGRPALLGLHAWTDATAAYPPAGHATRQLWIYTVRVTSRGVPTTS